MSEPGVHDAEMPTPQPLDERAIEALLSGRSVATGDGGSLATFVEDLRVATSGPPPAPATELAQLLQEGFSIDSPLPAPPVGASRCKAGTASRPKRRRRTMSISELLAALAAKLSAMGLAAKAALGVGLATATAAAGGAAGVLPDAAQHAVASVVNAVSPLQIPDVGGSGSTGTTGNNEAVTNPVGGLTGTDQPTVGGGTSTGDDPTGTGDQGQPADTHGACVSAVAKQAPTGAGGVHGKAVSEAAKSCPKPTGSDDNPGTSTTTTTVVTGGGSAGTTGSPGALGEKGKGQGQGEGNSTNANAGNGSRGRGR